MQETFLNAFADELEKLAAGWKPKNPRSVWQRRIGKRKYPISQALTSRRGRAALGFSGSGSEVGAAGGAIESHVGRWIEARGLKGRVRKGGKGLWGFEKRRLAEMANIPEKEIMPLLKRIQAKSGGKNKYPISRFITGTIPTLGTSLPSRAIHARALTGRATASEKQPTLFGSKKYDHFLKQEKDIVKMLRKERASMKRPSEHIREGFEAVKAKGAQALKGLKALSKAASCGKPHGKKKTPLTKQEKVRFGKKASSIKAKIEAARRDPSTKANPKDTGPEGSGTKDPRFEAMKKKAALLSKASINKRVPVQAKATTGQLVSDLSVRGK